MDTPEQIELEKYIHEQLQKLPPREAPENLVANVLHTIAARKSLPWWRQPFTAWPLGSQVILIAALVAFCGGVVFLLSAPLQQLSWTGLYERALSFSWVADAATTVGHALLLALKSASLQWLLIGAAVVFAMYGVCIAGGFALYRIASTHSLKQG